VDDPGQLAEGLMAGHHRVPVLLRAAKAICDQVDALQKPGG
jgi:hypothetical protein